MCVDQKEKMLVTAGMDQKLVFSNIGKEIAPCITVPTPIIKTLHFLPHLPTLAVGFENHSIELFSVQRKKFITTFNSHNDTVNCLRALREGELVSGS